MDFLEAGSDGASSQRVSRATSPGGFWRDVKDAKVYQVSAQATSDDELLGESDGRGALPARYRPRTFPYRRSLPYRADDNQYENLEKILRKLYISVSAGDFVPGATHWTRELRGWMQLKFDLPREDRRNLIKLYYELALAPGLEHNAGERFASMFMTLTKKKHYLKAGEDLVLDWRPLYRELKNMVLPPDVNTVVPIAGNQSRRSVRTLLKMCTFAQTYFAADQLPEVLEELLPYFSASNPETGFAVVGLLNAVMPTASPRKDSKYQPSYYLPTLFHLWSLLARSKSADIHFIDLFSRLARDCLGSTTVPFTEFGVFSPEQSASLYTAILKLLEIPVGQVMSPYNSQIDSYAGMAASLERDQRKHPAAHNVARWIVMSLSPKCLDKSNSILVQLEGLIQATETFFHPSNTGNWTKTLSQLVFYLADFFVMRWNREASEEMSVPQERKLTPAVRRRFVLCLRDVVFMGIFAKSGTAVSYSLSALGNLAFLEPTLVLPGALQRIYPALKGLVEVHRTTSAIRALRELARPMAKTKGFRCHLPALLGLALPGIDANDLDKTMHTLSFMQAAFYEIPMVDLTKQPLDVGGFVNVEHADAESEAEDNMLATQWITNQIERLETENADIEINYEREMSDTEEAAVARSSTADFPLFMSTFMERVLTLMRNMPDAARQRSGSPEESVANSLPAACTPLFSSMSTSIYEQTLNNLASYVDKHVDYQARDAMAFIISALTKVDAKKALSTFVPILIRNVRSEIEDNGAGASRTAGAEVMPGDKALIWNVTLLSMAIVNSGSAVVDFADELIAIASFMRQNCKGIPSTHASNLLHHILLTITNTYTLDHALFEESDLSSLTSPTALWSQKQDPRSLNIKWHVPDQREIDFAVKIFTKFADGELKRLAQLIGPTPPIKRDGTAKEWSDETSRSLVLLRLLMSGASALFDSRREDQSWRSVQMKEDDVSERDISDESEGSEDNELTDADYGATEDDDLKQGFYYPTGYPLDPTSKHYETMHNIRLKIGQALHAVHQFLVEKQEDDVTSFNALYTTYRSWFTDVGIERSAHVLDRVTRLFVADIGPFKMSGLRKQYPRPLLVRRANVYHLHRLRYNASPRPRTELDTLLLTDLITSSVSRYTEIRKTAQTAIESSMKVIIGARPVLIPPLLKHLEEAIPANDFPRIKGAMFSLLFGNLVKPLGRDWRYTPRLMKCFINVLDVDRPSVQRLSTGASLQIMDMTRQMSRMVILDPARTEAIRPEHILDEEKLKTIIANRSNVIQKRRDFIKSRRKELSDSLAETAQNSHWRKESRTATLVIGLSLRFDDIASETMVDLVVKRAVDTHPSLRVIYSNALIGLFTFIDTRAIADHKYENLLLEKKKVPGFVRLTPQTQSSNWTQKYLGQFSKANASMYIDQDYPGWLVWGKTVPGFQASARNIPDYDEAEQKVRKQIGAMLTRDWFQKYVSYMKQEPRDQSHDRFHMTNVLALSSAFSLVFSELTPATFEDIQELVKDTFGDGSDKHQHRATAEILGALLGVSRYLEPEERATIWAYAFPIVRGIFEDGITPENIEYWKAFIETMVDRADPRRSWPLVEWLSSFRLDMGSNAAFKESSKINLLEQTIVGLGWHFKMEGPILENFLDHLDHPYKGVREAMAFVLHQIYRTRNFEAYKDVSTLLQAQYEASSLGTQTNKPSKEFEESIKQVFDRIEEWRQERVPGQQEASAYTSGSKTVTLLLDRIVESMECTKLIPLFHETLLEPILQMMDVKEDPELQINAYSLFRGLGVVPFRSGEESNFVDALMRIGRTASSWHARLRSMVNMQAIYYCQLFLMPRDRQLAMFRCVAEMLRDTQLEVRIGAAATLSGMIRCSPVNLRNGVISRLNKEFTQLLQQNPLPRRKPGTPMPDHSKVILARHAAVLGLGSLVEAFPYASPPPSWVPEILATLATKAAGDPGMVGKSAKETVSDFKKTRQDTWHIDVKAFSPDQLEGLEGVLWKSYFA